MKPLIRKFAVISAIMGMISFSLVGCATPSEQQTTESSTSSISNTQTNNTQSGDTQSSNTQNSDSQSSQETSSQTETQEAILYIGRDNDFKEYALKYEGELKPETLIQGISNLTRWDLSLSDEVTTGKGGMTVSFAKTSALFVGPPENQKDEFFMYDAETLIPTILDSVKETLQENFVDTSAGGDPDSLNIYYCMEGDQPLTFDNINVTIPMDAPYTTFPKE